MSAETIRITEETVLGDLWWQIRSIAHWNQAGFLKLTAGIQVDAGVP
jgi:hypothetical protein